MSQHEAQGDELLTIAQASQFASEFLGKPVSNSNISYLLQYGRIRKFARNGTTLVNRDELIRYYHSHNGKREVNWRSKLGHDLNWGLSFDHLREIDTTKHVHRLHPYKGKFIPQLVEYFLDSHVDEFKTEVFFKKGDVVLDPFCGSGTTLVQANELGMHAVGIDISGFNSLISNVKIEKHNLLEILRISNGITHKLKNYIAQSNSIQFEQRLLEELARFNNRYFPSPDFKFKVKNREIDEDAYGAKKAAEFLPTFESLAKEFRIDFSMPSEGSFLDLWYIRPVRSEIDFVFELIKTIQDHEVKKVLSVVLSRTIRSCRATTHSDLATLKAPVLTTYYCTKHGKICKPLFSILSWWKRYTEDTIARLKDFDRIRTETHQICITSDSRTIDLHKELWKKRRKLYDVLKQQGIAGVFTSPPYVGLIDYHDQHAYAYDLFQFERQDELEIGPMFKGQGREARLSYVDGIAAVFNNVTKFLRQGANIFVVANDKFDLYSEIAKRSNLTLLNQYKRPVLNRTERDKSAYSESIFHFKNQSK